jgi:hypothetical protein
LPEFETWQQILATGNARKICIVLLQPSCQNLGKPIVVSLLLLLLLLSFVTFLRDNWKLFPKEEEERKLFFSFPRPFKNNL